MFADAFTFALICEFDILCVLRSFLVYILIGSGRLNCSLHSILGLNAESQL